MLNVSFRKRRMKLLVTSTLLAGLLIGASLWYSPESQAAFDTSGATVAVSAGIVEAEAGDRTVFASVQSPGILTLSLLAIGGLLALAGYNSRKPKRGRHRMSHPPVEQPR
jgi:hypothetical protein